MTSSTMKIRHEYDGDAEDFVFNLQKILDADEYNESYDPNKYISLNPEKANDPNNLLPRMLAARRYRGMVTALLECCAFDYNFTVDEVYPHGTVYDKFYRYHDASPITITIQHDLRGRNFTGTQFASFNLITRELTLTHYVVKVFGSFFNRRGTGEPQVDSDGYLMI